MNRPGLFRVLSCGSRVRSGRMGNDADCRHRFEWKHVGGRVHEAGIEKGRGYVTGERCRVVRGGAAVPRLECRCQTPAGPYHAQQRLHDGARFAWK